MNPLQKALWRIDLSNKSIAEIHKQLYKMYQLGIKHERARQRQNMAARP